MSKELKRLNLRMSQELFDYYKQESDEIGVPTSTYIVMVLHEHRKQSTAVQMLSQIPQGELQNFMAARNLSADQKTNS